MDVATVSRIASLALTPGNFFVLALIGGCAFSFTRWSKAGRLTTMLVAAALLAVAIFPIASWLAHPLESRYPPRPLPPRITGIVVLSGGEDDSRLLGAVTLMRLYPLSKVIFSGGTPPLTNYQEPESAVARSKLSLMGIEASRVIWESRARNTWENFKYSYEIAQPKRGDVWVVVTSGIHMPRAIEAANQMCWPVVPWPSERISYNYAAFSPGFDFSQHLRSLEAVVHEWLGFAAYKLFSRPGVC